jgi:hypothetical protein
VQNSPPPIECYQCGRAIPWGEPFSSLDYHIERTERPGRVQVEQADSLLIACIDCAPPRDALVRALRDAGFRVGFDPGD